MFRNIIWDVDGTLFDTYPAIARAFKAALMDELYRFLTLRSIFDLTRALDGKFY
jgi:phosphoglycolate phosphatase-like HAD superfamily hydrolase